MDEPGLADTFKNMQNDPELLAAFAEAQAELSKNNAKKQKKKKKKKNKVGDQLADLEKMMAQLESGLPIDLEASKATLNSLEQNLTKTKSVKKEKLPAPFATEPQESDVLKDVQNYNINIDCEPTPEEIEAEFQKLKSQQESRKKRKEKEKRKKENNLLRDEDGNVMLNENGVPISMDDPDLISALLEDEEDEELKVYLAKKKKKSSRRKKIKREKVNPEYEEDLDPSTFLDSEKFGWKKKDADKKMFQPSVSNIEATDEILEPMEGAFPKLPGEAGAGDVIVDDFGPTLPETGIPSRAETGAIPGGSKLKPIEDDEVIEKRLRQKALEKAIQERLDRRLMRQKRIEVRLASWIGKQQLLKNEAKQIAEERLQRAQEITEAMAPGVAQENEQYIKNRNQIVAEVRDKLRAEVSEEVRREIEEEENRKMRKSEKAPEAPKVPAAVMDAIQMSDAWEQFWRRYKSQLQDWKHWDEEQEEYHKQAAGWYFTQGFIQSQVINNVPKAPDEDPKNSVIDPTEPKLAQAATTAVGPVLNKESTGASATSIPPPPVHTVEEEQKIEKCEKRKKSKLEKYNELLKDPIFDPDRQPKYQPWGARDGEVRVQPGYVPAGIEEAPHGTTFAPKSAMPDDERTKLDRMKKMLAIVRGPQAMKNATYGTSYLPTQDDALQFIKLERFRRDRHRYRSSDHDSETDSDEEEENEPRQRGAKALPYLPQYQYGGTEELTTTTTKDTSQAVNVNQPGEMINPAGEAVPNSSSSDSSDSETEEQKDRRIKMAQKFNPAHIYGASTVETKAYKPKESKIQIRRLDGRTDTANVTAALQKDDEFSFDFMGGTDVVKKDKQKLYGRSKFVPKYLPQDDPTKGPGIHKEGPLKGLSKHWQQEQGLRQRPREDRHARFVEVSEEHLPPTQLDLPEYVQNNDSLPQTSEDIKNIATMAVRDYQREHMLMDRKKTRMEAYMERRNADKRFTAEPIKKKETGPKEEIEVLDGDLDFDPSTFFGDQTGGMFTDAKKATVASTPIAVKVTAPQVPKEQSAAAKKAFDQTKKIEPKVTKFASFGASWKKKLTVQTNVLETQPEVKDLPVKTTEQPKKDDEELPDFLKEQEKLLTETDANESGGFGWSDGKKKSSKDKKRNLEPDSEAHIDRKKGKKKKRFAASWLNRIGEDPEKPLRESAAGMDIDESELRTYNDGNPKPESTTVDKSSGDRDDRDWGAWKPRSRQTAKDGSDRRVAIKRKEGEISELHKKLLNPARFDYDPDFARAGSLQFMHPMQCSKVLGRPYPEDLINKGQKAFDDNITAYREPAPIQDPSELGPEPPPDGAIFWGVPEEVLTDPRLVVLKVGVPENCPGPEPRGWLDGLKRRKWYEKAQAPEIRAVHPASYFQKGDQLHQDKTFGVFYHPKYFGKTKEQKITEFEERQNEIVAESRASLAASFKT